MRNFIISRFCFILSAIALILTSCGKFGEDVDATRPVTLSAGLAGEAATKTALGNSNSVLWTYYDCISVLDGSENRWFELTGGDGTTSATFSGEISASSAQLFAISPFQMSASLSGSTVSGLTMPAAQTPCPGSFDPEAAFMCAYSASPTGNLQFHNISSYFKFTPQFDCSSVEITCGGGEALAGTFSVQVGSDGTVSQIEVTSGASSSVSLSGMTIESDKTYLVGVLPGTLTKGFTITFTAASGGAEYSRSAAGPVTLTGGRILNLGEFAAGGPWDTDEPAVESVSLSRNAIGLVQGKGVKLTATVLPSEAPQETVWTSSDSSVASVASDGTVSALKAGSCTVTAAAGGVSASCKITVIANSQSVFRYGYSELNTTEKKAYDYMLERIFAFEDNAKAYGDINNRVYLDFASLGYYPQYTDVQRLTNIIMKDVPETYPIVNYVFRYDYGVNQYYLRLNLAYSTEKFATQMAAIYGKRDTFLASITSGASEFDKARSVRDIFIKNTIYGDMTGADAGNIIGGLVNGRVVCEGYARTYLFLCQQAGLSAIYIVGSFQQSSVTDTWENHAWNHVKIGDSWYLVDVTCDGGLVGSTAGYRNFLLGRANAETIHRYTYTDGSDGNVSDIAYSALPALNESDYPMTR